MDNSKKLNIFRIIQEALNNIKNHAHAHTASVTATKNNENHIVIYITDDGCGFDRNTVLNMNNKNPSQTHFGIKGIQQRVKLMQGEITIITAQGEGTEIKIEI